MTNANGNSLQGAVLEAIKKQATKTEGDGTFHYQEVVEEVKQKRKAGRQVLPQDEDFSLRRGILAYWNAMLRSGILSFGKPHSPNGWDSNVFHLTETGRKTLEQLGRDPINPDGYMKHLRECVSLDQISESYIKEALHTYQAGCHKATAVMIGTAAEGMILHLRDTVSMRLLSAKKKVPKELDGWKIKAVCDALAELLEAHQKHMPPELSGRFDTYWNGFTSHVRVIRNKSGHPNSIDPISSETVHAALLNFLDFARLVKELEAWAASHPF